MADLIAGDLTTKAILGTDLASYGTIDTSGDVDWYRIQLQPGNYHVNLFGDPLFGHAISDTLLRIYNSAGEQVAIDDDNGGDSYSYIDFTVGGAGTYYISAGAFTTYTGDYALSVTTNDVAIIPLDVGTTQTSRADAAFELDTYRANLIKDVVYTFKMEPQAGVNGPNSDPITPVPNVSVRINDPDGIEIGRDNSSANGQPVTITFTANKTGAFDFKTFAQLHSASGHYSVTLSTATPPLEHRPSGGAVTVSMQEDTAFASFTRSMFPFSDADGNSFGGITVISAPSSGTLTLGNSVVTAGQIVTRDGLANLRYTPAPNANGPVSFSFAVYELTGRLAHDLSPDTFTFNIAAVNDAPTITSNGGASAVQFDLDEGAAFSANIVATDGELADVQDVTILVHNIAGNTIGGTKKSDTVDASHGVNTKTATYEEDYIDGKKGNDKLNGLDGNDTLIGGAGKDTLTGGAGSDRLDGGKDGDQYVFSVKFNVEGIDSIVKFEHGKDKIGLDDKVFKAIGSSLSGDEFYAKAGAVKAHDKSDHVIYNKTTGDLYYDTDGKGGAKAVLFAHLDNHPSSLDHHDFLIV